MGGRFDDRASRARSLHLAMSQPWRFDTLALAIETRPSYAPAARIGAVCRLDGAALVLHARCAGCGFLSGQAHADHRACTSRSSSDTAA